jgi:ornithine carbamoyltransferase
MYLLRLVLVLEIDLMTTNLYGRSFLSLLDFSSTEVRHLLELAHALKLKRQQGRVGRSLQGKHLALVFEKASTRTRCAFEISMVEEGGYATYLDNSGSQFGKKESVEDSAKVLAAYYQAIAYRGFSQPSVVELARHAQIPVYNALTDEDHPTQILADLMTIEELLPHKPLSQVKVAYVGDTRNNLAKAWMYGCAIMGMHFVAYGPVPLHPQPELVATANSYAAKSGGSIEISDNISCLADVDIIYTDVWVSMGEEDQLLDRVNLLKEYQVTMPMLAKTQNPKVLFMHCLPAFHDRQTKFACEAYTRLGVDISEVTDEVFKSQHSVVFHQAENRLHSIKAILVATLGQTNNS